MSGRREPAPLCLLCRGSSSPTRAPHPLRTRACAKCVSWPLGTHHCSGDKTTLTGESLSDLAAPRPIPWPSLFPTSASKPAPLQGHAHRSQVQWGWGCPGRGGWLWGRTPDCLRASSLVTPGVHLWNNSSSPVPSWFCLRPRPWALLPDGGPSHPLYVKKPSPPPMGLPALYVPFLIPPQAAWGSVWLRVWQRKDKYCINKKKKEIRDSFLCILK